MRAANSALLARTALRMLDMQASVYARGSTGRYDGPPVKTGLKCLLQAVNRQSAATGPDRTALAKEANFKWEPTYDMPESAQIEVDAYPGQRWNTKGGTFWTELAPGAVPIYRRCDVVKA